MILKDNEIWPKVVELIGKELFTYIDDSKNTILDVEDFDSKSDRVLILERETYPTREDIIAAYLLFINVGRLKRSSDLEWLSRPQKKVSSIVFRIIGEISKSHNRIDYSKKEPVILLTI